MKIFSFIVSVLWTLLFAGHCRLAYKRYSPPTWSAFLANEAFIVFIIWLAHFA